MGVDESYWIELLRPVLTGRRVIITGGPVAGLVGKARLARSLGAERPFILGNEGLGTGELPSEDEAEVFALDVSDAAGTTMMHAVRAGAAALADLPADALAAIDRYDPDRSALVLGSFLNEHPSVAGRRCLAYRKPEWVALEDKLLADALWDRAGVARAPSAVVPATRDALVDAATELDAGAGTVWVGDAREGFHGGGEYARWIRIVDDVPEAAAFLAAHCDRARVMPFATILESQRIGAPLSSALRAALTTPGENMISGAISTMPLAWMMRTATRSSSGEKRVRSASARMIAKERS